MGKQPMRDAFIMERLNRGLATPEWINSFPMAKIIHLPNYQSDHLPVLLRLEPLPRKGPKQFRVEQWWAQHPGFKPICRKAAEEGRNSWEVTCAILRKEVRSWSEGCKDPNWELNKIEREMKLLIEKNQTTLPQSPSEIPAEVAQNLTAIPPEEAPNLDRIPTEEEVRWAVFSLGPTKSPGPDGVTAAFIQENWDSFKPVVVSEVLTFFQIGRLKDFIAHSTLVLIPKVPAPTLVTEFRPISACNFLYKVISKILARKIQPFINGLISHSQTAFISGREISENIVLLREVIHSFSLRSSKQQSFAFKADLAKAFDSVRWEYFFKLLPLCGFPQRMCGWIQECVRSAKFTIQLNRRGDRFFRPTRGLKQGCSMSLYLFIIAMDPLARWLNLKMAAGTIRGLKLARTAPQMACSLFADDLILTGLTINTSKSKVWFSHNSVDYHKSMFRSHFDVQEASENESYLGCPVTVSGRASFDYLIDKFEKRLNLWKAKMLSHAGRLILIKSVLESLPVYTMGTAIIPTRVLKKLTGIMRNFFWGGDSTKNYMSYLWRNLVSLKPLLQVHVVWKIGSGATVRAFSQPWFSGWELIRPANSAQRNVTVSSLLSQHHESWDFEKLQLIFGFEIALIISMNEAIRPAPAMAQDLLLFTYAKDGRFTVKKAYRLLKGDTGNERDKKFWSAVWGAKGLAPKLKFFIWRCVSNALLVRGVIGARIQLVPMVCQRGGLVPESVEHMLFTCDFSRAAWLSSPLSLRSDQLHGTFREIISSLFDILSELDVMRFVCMSWAIWRVKNEAIIGGKQQSFPACFKYYKEVLLACQSVHFTPLVPIQQPTGMSVQSQPLMISQSTTSCYVDGSWSQDGLVGIGAYITVGGKVVQWISKRVQAMNSTHAEAIAVLQGYKMLLSVTTERACLFSDSLEIFDSLAHKQPLIHDWRSFNEVWEAWQIQKDSSNRLSLIHCGRENESLKVTHLLANLGRTIGWDRMEQDLDLSIEVLDSCVRSDLL
ncbi:uncharacterized protein LOC144553235 [Carex rostrata]